MKKVVLLTLTILLFSFMTLAQEEPTTTQEPAAAETKAAPEKPEVKKIPTDKALKIRDLQIRLVGINQQKEQLQKAEAQIGEQLRAVIQDIYKAAGLKQEEWQINDNDWTFVAAPKPPAAAKAAPKKDEATGAAKVEPVAAPAKKKPAKK